MMMAASRVVSRSRQQHRRRICGTTLHCSGEVVEGDDNVIEGDDNVVLGRRNHVYGSRNRVPWPGNFVHGPQNEVGPGNIAVQVHSSSSNNSVDEQLRLFFERGRPVREGLGKRKRAAYDFHPDQDRAASEEEHSCIVCRENIPCVVFKPCHHLCCCAGCAIQLQSSSGCPLCQQKIKRLTRAVFAGYAPDIHPKKAICVDG